MSKLKQWPVTLLLCVSSSLELCMEKINTLLIANNQNQENCIILNVICNRR